MKTTPDVFIVESLKFSDEKRGRSEGSFLSHVLQLAGRRVEYYYIRTRVELEEIMDRFDDSGFRYLHISCHANRNGVGLTLDDISVQELGKILAPYLEKRRVFFSACELATEALATTLLRGTGCHSVIAPSKKIYFDAAAIFWASLYHLMFRDDSRIMTRAELQTNLTSLSEVFDVAVKYYAASRSARSGFTEVTVGR